MRETLNASFLPSKENGGRAQTRVKFGGGEPDTKGNEWANEDKRTRKEEMPLKSVKVDRRLLSDK